MNRAEHINHVRNHIQQTLEKRPIITMIDKGLPCSHHEILSYVDQLLTPREREACDLATD